MEQLCIFCEHFKWSAESCWGTGSTMTGPMMEGGDATCAKGHYKGQWDDKPENEEDFRKIILRATGCQDYKPPNAELTGDTHEQRHKEQ